MGKEVTEAIQSSISDWDVVGKEVTEAIQSSISGLQSLFSSNTKLMQDILMEKFEAERKKTKSKKRERKITLNSQSMSILNNTLKHNRIRFTRINLLYTKYKVIVQLNCKFLIQLKF